MQTPLIDRFNRCVAGGMAVTFAVALPMLALAVGGGIDVSNALIYRQKLASALELGCQQSTLDINYKISQGSSASSDFSSLVNKDTANKISDAGMSASASATSTTSNASNIAIVGSGNSPAAFAQVLNRSGFPIQVKRECLYNQANQGPPVGASVFTESFETASSYNLTNYHYDFFGANGSIGGGGTWNGWSLSGPSVEIDDNQAINVTNGIVLFGQYFAELDSDCNYVSNCTHGSSNTNSTISRNVSIKGGATYEISYWYESRVRDQSYTTDPYISVSGPSGYGATVHCGAATDPLVTQATWAQQTNRIDVYVEPVSSNTFASKYIYDSCVYSDHWTERDVYFTAPSTGTYRISWRAAGLADTYGGLIDYLRLCSGTCP